MLPLNYQDAAEFSAYLDQLDANLRVIWDETPWVEE